MSVVDFNSLFTAKETAMSACGEFQSEMGAVHTALSAISGAGLEGEAANNMQAYIQEVHGTMFSSVTGILDIFVTKFRIYVDGLMQLDSNVHACIPQSDVSSGANAMTLRNEEITLINNKLGNAIASVAGLVNLAAPSINALTGKLADEYDITTSLNAAINDHEAAHASDLAEVNAMLGEMESLVNAQTGKNRIGVDSYVPGAIAGMMDLVTFAVAAKALEKYAVGIQSDMDALAQRELAIYEVLNEEAAEARAWDGVWSAVAAVGAIVVGVSAIVFTAGAAAPAALVAIGYVSGVSAAAYGVSNLSEATQEIMYGLSGDTTTRSWNLLRDTVFQGNQQAYDIWGGASTIIAGACIPTAQAINIAKQAGMTGTQTAVLVGRALGTKAVSGAIAGVTGKFAGNIATEATGNENIGKATQLAVTVAVGAGEEKLDRTYNVSGLHPQKNVLVGGQKNAETGEKEVTYDVVDEDGNVVRRKTRVIESENKYHTPENKAGVGHYDGERGNSTYIPEDPEMKAIMKEYNVEGVKYTDNQVDFDPFAKHTNTPYGDFDSTVTIDNMSGERLGKGGNYDQYFEALSEKTGVPKSELIQYAEANGYTVHECPDGRRVQLVPTSVNSYFKHTGGTSYANYTDKVYGFLDGLSTQSRMHLDAALENLA